MRRFFKAIMWMCQLAIFNPILMFFKAISWMGQLARFNPIWIEEPTSADDIQAHADISTVIKSTGCPMKHDSYDK